MRAAEAAVVASVAVATIQQWRNVGKFRLKSQGPCRSRCHGGQGEKIPMSRRMNICETVKINTIASNLSCKSLLITILIPPLSLKIWKYWSNSWILEQSPIFIFIVVIPRPQPQPGPYLHFRLCTRYYNLYQRFFLCRRFQGCLWETPWDY